jgi:hypothetical protein
MAEPTVEYTDPIVELIGLKIQIIRQELDFCDKFLHVLQTLPKPATNKGGSGDPEERSP